MDNKRIKVMALIWSMGNGGAEKIVLNNLRELYHDRDIEFRVYVFTSPEDSANDREIEERKYPVTYMNYPKSRVTIPYIRGPFNICVARRAFEAAIREYQPDIVHVHIDALLDKALYGIVKNNVPVRFDTLHSDPARNHGRILKTIRRAFIKEHFIPICLNKAQALKGQRIYGYKNYEILNNGTDYDNIRSKIIGSEAARKQLNLPEDAYVVCAVGRLHSIKNYPLMLEAIAEAKKVRPNILLIIAGDGEEKAKLKEKAATLGILEQVCFLGNMENVVPVYCAADKFCLTSYSESSSLVLIEAQVAGLQCVISDGCPSESIITDRVRKMKKDASIREWAEAILDRSYTGEAVSDPDDFDLKKVNGKLKRLYIYYYEEYAGKK